MKQLIACCGLDYENCDARIATVRDDNELREKTAQKWSIMNNAPEITPATINCMGCRTDGAKFAYCNDYCPIRKCVNEKGYKTGFVMWPIRTALSGKQMTPAGATEIMEVLGKEESLKRIRLGIEKLSNGVQ